MTSALLSEFNRHRLKNFLMRNRGQDVETQMLPGCPARLLFLKIVHLNLTGNIKVVCSFDGSIRKTPERESENFGLKCLFIPYFNLYFFVG
jgi:hypothetical protein